MEEGEQSGQVEDDPHRDADLGHEDGGWQKEAAPQRRIHILARRHINKTQIPVSMNPKTFVTCQVEYHPHWNADLGHELGGRQ